MRKPAYPAFCPAGEASFLSLSQGVSHYEKMGFVPFDADEGWQTMRKDGGVFEAYICRVFRANLCFWRGTVVQLREETA